MNYVIALDGSGDFTTIQAAIDAASAGDTLTVRPGTYEERVVVHKDDLHIIGECGAALTGKGCAKDQYPDGREKGTFLSATLLVLGSDVTVEHMTIRNDAGDGEKVGQAVAVYAAGDRGIWKNCRFIAHQDTLFCGPVMQKVLDEIAPRTLDTVEMVESTGNCPLTHSRQYFENCFIQGDVDYIFGPYRCWFENCTLYMNARGGWYTAANTPEEQPWGLVFHNCRLTGVCEPGAGNLGRPWRQFARTLFMACDMDEHVNPQGFVNWENWDGVREITDRCGEWHTTGVRADQSMRHPNQKRLTDAEAAEVTIENVLNGWKPVKESTRLEKSTMINSNPIQKGQPVGKKFITMGEIMLRLTPPNYNKIRMATSFEASYGGSEANIALALASLKVDSTFFSVVPDNAIGKSAIRALRSSDVHCTPVILSTPEETPSHRLGTYYLETGFGIRPSKVVYDRKHSALTEYDFSGYDLRGLLQDYDWLHLSGITPALSENCRKLTMDMLKVARELGLTISFDGNFRSTLWTWEEARDFCTECLPYVDVLLGIEPYHVWRDPQDHSKGDVKDGVPLQPAYEQQDEVFQAFIERWPNLKCIARHVRYAHSGSENSLKAYMWYDGHTFESKLFTFNILDRVGGGDAFASGLIYAMMHEYKPMDMLNFAVASSVIKHTIHGDANITDDVGSIRNLMNMNYDIKR